MSTGLAEQTAAHRGRNRKPGRTSVKPEGRKAPRADGRVKSTLLLGGSLDFRLTTVAASLRLDRSQLAAQLIDAGLQRYALDRHLRSFEGETLPVGEDRQETAA
jgi:hypothetical protein